MTDQQFEKLKTETESELGRLLDHDEEHELKTLYYFGKGVKLKSQIQSEPVHISQVLPEVMDNIAERMQRQRQRHIVQATGDFLSRQSRRSRTVSRKGRNKATLNQKRGFLR